MKLGRRRRRRRRGAAARLSPCGDNSRTVTAYKCFRRDHSLVSAQWPPLFFLFFLNLFNSLLVCFTTCVAAVDAVWSFQSHCSSLFESEMFICIFTFMVNWWLVVLMMQIVGREVNCVPGGPISAPVFESLRYKIVLATYLWRKKVKTLNFNICNITEVLIQTQECIYISHNW